jgi:CheY-like chemotaxis protein
MILIVDDHPDNCELLAHFLKADGFEAECVHSGEAAIESVESSIPTVIVLDDFMPGMTGLDVIRQLRENPRYSALPIVFYSAGQDMTRRDRAMSLGAADWLVKGKNSWHDVVSKIEALAR